MLGGETKLRRHCLFRLLPPPRRTPSDNHFKNFSRSSRIWSLSMWRGVGQKESPFDSRLISASLKAFPERFTTVVGASWSLLVLVEWVTLLRNCHLSFFFCCWYRIVLIRDSGGRRCFNLLFRRSHKR